MQKTTRNATILGVGLSISAFIGWLFLREAKRSPQPDTIVRSRIAEPETISEIPLPLEDTEDDGDSASTGDDLTEIRGIGPLYAGALRSIGIHRFEQLAAETPDSLAERLTPHVSVNPQRIRDDDWIGQAARKAQR